MGRALVERILRRLDQAGWRETNPHLQDDYRIAALTVLLASHGHRDPHVAACYTVLGLHPAKVLPAIIARRKAMLGAEYESFFSEQPPLELALREWEEKLPPKKPPQSVRLEDVEIGEQHVRKKIVGDESQLPAGGRDARKLAETQTARAVDSRRQALHFETPIMASTNVAYPKPGAQNRAKNAAHAPFSRIDQIIVSTAPSHLQNTLRWLLRFNRFGSELWPSTDSIAVAAFKSRRTIQRHLDELVEELYDCQDCTNRQAPSARNCCRRCGSAAIKATGLRVLEMIEQPNDWVRYGGKWTFRHSATYRFHAAALAPRKTYEQYADERAARRPKRPRCTPNPAGGNTAAPELVHPPMQLPAQSPAPAAEKKPTPKIRLLRSGQASQLVNLVKRLQRPHGRPPDPKYAAPDPNCGKCHGSGSRPHRENPRLQEHCACWVSPDPDYRPGMSQHAALVAACEELGYQLEAALEYFKLVPGWKVGDA